MRVGRNRVRLRVRLSVNVCAVPALVSHNSSPLMEPTKPKIYSQMSAASEALVQQMMGEMLPLESTVPKTSVSARVCTC